MSGNHTHTPWATAWQLSYTGDEWHFAREASFSPSDIERGIVKNITHLSPSSQAEIERLKGALQTIASRADGYSHGDDHAAFAGIANIALAALAALSGSKE